MTSPWLTATSPEANAYPALVACLKTLTPYESPLSILVQTGRLAPLTSLAELAQICDLWEEGHNDQRQIERLFERCNSLSPTPLDQLLPGF